MPKKPRKKSRTSEVLMIVDLQCGFKPPARLVERVRRYARRFERRVFTRLVSPAGSPFRDMLGEAISRSDSAETQLLVAPEPGDIVLLKRTYGLQPAHLRRLRREGIECLTLCGIDTDACVLGVAFSLFDAGIYFRVKGDLCWSATGLHREALKIVRMQFPLPPGG